MFLIPAPNKFQWAYDSRTDRPSTTDGTSTTPGNNTMGSWSSAIISSANMASDVWWIDVWISSGAGSAASRPTLIDIGVDPAGGTAYSVILPNLLASNSSPYATFGGIHYGFPIHIKAGSSLAARSSNVGAAGNPRIAVRVFGRPTEPELLWKGGHVTDIGTVSGSSTGTSITSGTTSEGSWTSLGTSPSSACRYIEVGFGCDNTTMSALGHHMDVGYGASAGDTLLVQDVLASTTAAEQISKPWYQGVFCYVPPSSSLWGRMQCSGTPVTVLSMAVYLVC